MRVGPCVAAAWLRACIHEAVARRRCWGHRAAPPPCAARRGYVTCCAGRARAWVCACVHACGGGPGSPRRVGAAAGAAAAVSPAPSHAALAMWHCVPRAGGGGACFVCGVASLLQGGHAERGHCRRCACMCGDASIFRSTALPALAAQLLAPVLKMGMGRANRGPPRGFVVLRRVQGQRASKSKPGINCKPLISSQSIAAGPPSVKNPHPSITPKPGSGFDAIESNTYASPTVPPSIRAMDAGRSQQVTAAEALPARALNPL